MDNTQSFAAQQVLAPKISNQPDFPSYVAAWLKWVELRRSTLSTKARLALLILADYAKAGQVYPSIGHMADLMGCTENTARLAIRELETAELIRREAHYDHSRYFGGAQATNRYHLLVRATLVQGAWKGRGPVQDLPEPPSRISGPSEKKDHQAKHSVVAELAPALVEEVRTKLEPGPAENLTKVAAVALKETAPPIVEAALRRTLAAPHVRNPPAYFQAVLREVRETPPPVALPTSPRQLLVREIQTLNERIAITLDARLKDPLLRAREVLVTRLNGPISAGPREMPRRLTAAEH